MFCVPSFDEMTNLTPYFNHVIPAYAGIQTVSHSASQVEELYETGSLGIYIHRLLSRDGKASTKGDNPFGYIKLKNGLTIANHPQNVTAYNPPYTDSKDVYGHIRDHLEEWVENAIKNRRQ